uniref:Band 7 domain-containing protein n=1 Tax=Alexandrium catenella TaxID=2925 RepID=A0A7S1WFL9_ALECA|mmetsp:Transcript_56580/g.151497  ORF Transcript_56580/g.151497 Transcript_56580/m.151497 type:complete len:281 (+) Transcript_56580:97-939(+)
MAEVTPLVGTPTQEEMKAADSGASGCYNLLSNSVGNIYSVLAVPCGICGGGPMVTIQQGFVGLITKFGKFDRLLPPGRYAYNIMSEQIMSVSLKTICLDVPPQNVITADNLSIGVNAVCYYRVVDACKAMFEVDDYSMAISQLAQVTLRTVLGEHSLTEVLTARSTLNARVTQLIDEETDKWGIKVLSVEMKDVQIPEGMRRAMAAVAESSREGEAKIISAKAQRDSAEILADAASKMKGDPVALQLQWFDTLQKIAQEKNSTIIVPDSLLGMASKLAGK